MTSREGPPWTSGDVGEIREPASCHDRAASGFAVVVPFGPGDEEPERLRDLFESLVHYGPVPRWFVVIEDAPTARFIGNPFGGRDTEVLVLQNPRRGVGVGHLGGLATGILAGLDWLWAHTNCRYALKLDTDSLIIGSLSCLDDIVSDTSIGLAGCVGRTCDRQKELPGWERAFPSPVLQLLKTTCREGRKLCPRSPGRPDPFAVTESRAAAMEALIADVGAARRNGYSRLHYCQGGGYVVTRRMMDLMAALGCFERAIHWADIPIGEDVILGMYAYAVGLTIADFSKPGQPFGVDWSALPFAPPELMARGHSITHSVKSNATASEAEMRHYFRRARHRGDRSVARRTVKMGADHLWLYANEHSASLLDSRDPKIAVLGAYSADRSFGRVAAFHSLRAVYAEAAADSALLPAYEASHLLSLGTPSSHIPVPHLVFCERELPGKVLDQMQVRPVERVRRVSILHSSGGPPDESVALAQWLGLADRLRAALGAEAYRLSGQQVADCEMNMFRDHVRATSPEMIGCSDPETAAQLQQQQAVWTGHDGLHSFLKIAADSDSAAPSGCGEVYGFDLALPPHLLEDGEVNHPSRMREVLQSIRTVACTARNAGPRATAVVVNSRRDRRECQDSWSVLRHVGLPEVFPRFAALDLASPAMSEALTEARRAVLSAGITRFVATSVGPALFLTCCGVPSHVMTFNAFSRRAVSGMGQKVRCAIDFVTSSGEPLRRTHQSLMKLLRRLRSDWEQAIVELGSC